MNTTDSKVWVRALTVATIAAAAAVLSGCSLLGQLDDVTGGTGGDDDPFSIKVGECFNDDVPGNEGDEVTSIAKVECAEPHIWEAYSSVIIEEGDGAFPGSPAITEQGDADCLTAFEPYVGISYDDSTLYFSYYSPTEKSWTDGNDREILCIVTTTDDFETKATGSVKGSAK